MENSLKELKKENRMLKQNLSDVGRDAPFDIKLPGEVNPDQIANLSDNTVIRTHIQSLNQALGKLWSKWIAEMSHNLLQLGRRKWCDD